MAKQNWIAAILLSVLFTLIPGLAKADDTIDTPNYSVGQVLPDGRTVLYAWKSEKYVLGDIHKAMGGVPMTYNLGNVCEIVRSCANVPGGCDYVAWGSSDTNHYEQQGLDNGLEGGLAAGRAGRASMAAIRACAGTTWDTNLYPHTPDEDRYSGIAIFARVPPKPKAQCADGIDNDGDGLIDFTPPSGKTKDDGCTSVEDDNEMTEDQKWAYLIPIVRSHAGNPCNVTIEGWYENREPKHRITGGVCACSVADVNEREGFQMFSPAAAMSIADTDMRTTQESASTIVWSEVRVWLEAPMRSPDVEHVDAQGNKSSAPIGRGATVTDGGDTMTIYMPDNCPEVQDAKATKADKAHDQEYDGADGIFMATGNIGASLPSPGNIYGLQSRAIGDGLLELGGVFGKHGVGFMLTGRLGGGGDQNCFQPGHGLLGLRFGASFRRSRMVGFHLTGVTDIGLAPWHKTVTTQDADGNNVESIKSVAGMAFFQANVSARARIAFGRGDHAGFVAFGPYGGIRLTSADPVGGEVSAMPVLIPDVGGDISLGFTW